MDLIISDNTSRSEADVVLTGYPLIHFQQGAVEDSSTFQWAEVPDVSGQVDTVTEHPATWS
jgi:hypothetical protein